MPPSSITPSDSSELDKLGRARPEVFSSRWTELGFCVSILGSMMISEFLISGFNVVLPVLLEQTGIDASQKTWPSSIFSLVTGALLLPFGRLTDMYGCFPVYFGGLAWLLVSTVVLGFAQDLPLLLAARALQGVGAAAYLPAGMTLLGTTYRPGPRKNTIFSLYGGCAPFGFFTGIVVAGLCGEYTRWSWYAWIAAVLLLALCVLTAFCVPHRWKRGDLVSMDWWGTLTSVASLGLLNYAFTDAAHVDGRFASPKILVTLVLGVVLMAVFIYIEGWVVEKPLLPGSLFRIKFITPLFLALFIAYGGFGVYLFYSAFYIETILGVSPVVAACWFAPLAVGGITIALLGGFTLHKLPGTILLLLSATGFTVSSLLFALIPADPNYWAWVFPAMVCATIGVDIAFNVSGIFITSNVPQDQQGLAGACVNGLVFLGMSFFQGWADYAVATKSNQGSSEGESFKAAFHLGIACGGAVILIVLGFVRIGRAKSDLTFEEKRQSQSVVH